jgi:hypothetical protein
MSAEQTLNKIKQQNRDRAKRYYLKNKSYVPPTASHEPTPRTVAFYNDTLKTLNTILGESPNYTKYKDIIKKINNATYKNKPYSTNTKKNFYQLILKLITENKIKVSITAYEKYKYNFDLLKIISKDSTALIQESGETVMTFDEYLPLIKNEYGEKSKEYLISKLYSFNGFRDDLNLTIITEPIEAGDDTKNYVIIPSDEEGVCLIILNEYKTKSKYGVQNLTIPPDISLLIKNYKKNNNLNDNELLFNSKSLSSYIKKFNNKIGLNITINKFRQMKISEQLNQHTSPEERLELSKTMKHSPDTSKHYKRNI